MINRAFRQVWAGWLCLLSLAVQTILPAKADEAAGSTTGETALTLRGFGTLGFVRTDNDNASFVRDLSQPDGATRRWSSTVDSLLGVQAALRLDDRTEGVIQAISRYRYDGSHAPEISWAYLRRELAPDLQVRLGRLGTEFYMLADSRLVGYANLTVRPPPDYYGPLIISYLDGLDISGVLPAGDGLLRGKVFAGRAAERSPFVGPLNWDLHGSPLVGGHLDYLAGPWQIRASHTRIRFEHELPLNDLVGFDLLSSVPALAMKDTWTRFDALGLVYDAGPIQFQGMISRIAYETLSYEDARAGYLIASYRLPHTTPYLGYSRVRSSAGHPGVGLPAPLGALVNDLVASSHSDQHTVFLGVRWDIQHNLALKAQLDLVRGSSSSVFPVREPDRHWNGRLNVFSLAMDFVF